MWVNLYIEGGTLFKGTDFIVPYIYTFLKEYSK